MAEWKKVVVSGSATALTNLQVDGLTASEVVIGGGSAGNLTTTGINGTGNILATSGATSVQMTGSFSGSFKGLGTDLDLSSNTTIPAGKYKAGSGNKSIQPTDAANNATASGNYSVVAGGEGNTASSVYSGVFAGESNKAQDESSAVLAGKNNETGTSAKFSVIGGGDGNCVTGEYSALMNGNASTVSGDYAFLGSGINHTLSGNYGTISGGYANTVSGEKATVAGGTGNLAQGNNSSVVGGGGNSAQAVNSTVGGCDNTVTTSGNYSTISGGYTNTISAYFGGILGGRDNTVNTACSFIVGSGINGTKANHTHVSNLTTTGNITGSAVSASGGVIASTAKVADLTSGRVVLAGTGGELQDNSGLTFNGSVLGVSGAITNASTVAATKLTGSFTGSFIGDGSQLTGVASTLTVDGDAGSQDVDLTSDDLQFLGTAGEITTAITKVGTDVKVSSSLATTITKNRTFSGDLITFNKDIRVLGTASFDSTQNLKVADRFIALASGSGAAGDGGIVIEQSNAGGGKGQVFGFDNANGGRWGLLSGFNATASAFTPSDFMVTTAKSTSVPVAAPTYGGTTGQGNMHVKTDTGDIYIYA